MNHVEAHVRAPLPRIAVVLQERVQKHLGVEKIIHAAGDQRRRESALREIDVVELNRARDVEVLVCTDGRADRIAMAVAIIELTDGIPGVEGEGRGGV